MISLEVHVILYVRRFDVCIVVLFLLEKKKEKETKKERKKKDWLVVASSRPVCTVAMISGCLLVGCIAPTRVL